MSNQNACICILRSDNKTNTPPYEYRVRYYPNGCPAWTTYAHTHPNDALPQARRDFDGQTVYATYGEAWEQAQGIVRHDDIVACQLHAKF